MLTLRCLSRIAREVCTIAGVFVCVTACTQTGGSVKTTDLTAVARLFQNEQSH